MKGRFHGYTLPALVVASIILAGCEGAPLYSVTGWVWLDENRNGVQDVGETAMSNVLVTLELLSESSSVDTGPDGRYTFSWLGEVGEDEQVPVVLRVRLPAGYRFTPAGEGPEDLDSDIEPDTGETQLIVVPPDSPVEHVDAGLIPAETEIEITPLPALQPTPTPTYSSSRPAG